MFNLPFIKQFEIFLLSELCFIWLSSKLYLVFYAWFRLFRSDFRLCCLGFPACCCGSLACFSGNSTIGLCFSSCCSNLLQAVQAFSLLSWQCSFLFTNCSFLYFIVRSENPYGCFSHNSHINSFLEIRKLCGWHILISDLILLLNLAIFIHLHSTTPLLIGRSSNFQA